MLDLISDQALNQKNDPQKEAATGIYQGMNEAIYRINQYFIPLLQKAESPLEARFRIMEKVRNRYIISKYKEWNGSEHRFRKSKSGLLCEIFRRDNIDKSLLVQVAVRFGRTNIADYPRFHMPSDIKDKTELWEQLKNRAIHFCILTIDGNDQPAYFCLDRFDSIPEEKFRLVRRNKGRRKDRLVPTGKGRRLISVGQDGSALIHSIHQAINQRYCY